jgi:XisI protein
MEKIKKYQDIITQILEEYAAYFDEPNIEAQVICDYQRNHYQLVKTGWDNGQRYHYCIFHFDIKNEKIWLQENNTDIRIILEIEKLGVPKSDIVLAIHSPTARLKTDYAVA